MYFYLLRSGRAISLGYLAHTLLILRGTCTCTFIFCDLVGRFRWVTWHIHCRYLEVYVHVLLSFAIWSGDFAGLLGTYIVDT